MSTPTKDPNTEAAAPATAPESTVAPKKAPAKPKKPAGKPLRRIIYEWLYKPKNGVPTRKSFENYLSILIIANIAIMLFELIPSVYEPNKKWFHVFDVFSIIIFTMEYLLRLYVAPEDPEFSKSRFPRIKYIFSIYAIIDLAAVLNALRAAFPAGRLSDYGEAGA